MEVVILAAGKGDRFAAAGFTTMKPLIQAKGRPMISYALEQAAVVTKKPVIICPESVMFDIWRCAPPELDVCPSTVAVRYTQQGAAMSLLLAGAKLPEDEPVMVMDCDSVVSLTAIHEFKEYSLSAFNDGYSSSIMAFRPKDGSSRYSFVRASLTNEGEYPDVVTVSEKTRISDIATCGVHAFRSWDVLRRGIIEMAYRKVTVNGEFYVAPVHNCLDRTTMYIVQDGDFTAIGTPEQLEAYEASE